MKNVADILRQAHDVLYDELNRNVREMTVTESDFIRDCLDEMDNWIQNAERKFKRADSVKSSRRLFSSEGSSKTTGKTKQEFYENVKRDLDCEIYDDDGKFLTIEIDGDFYEAEYTKYMRGGYELMHYNLHKTSSRRDAFQSRKSVKSSVENAIRELSEYFQRTPDGDTIYPRYKITRDDEIEIGNICYENDVDFAMDEYSVTVYPKDEDDEDEDIYSGCHGKSDKRRREEKEDELESSRNAKTFSKFNRISSLFIKNDVLKPGKTGIELNINGWKIINKEGKPTGGEAAEFNSEKAAKASEIYRKLADRYGAENVRTFKQD